METIAMWCSVAGIFISIFAIVILYLTRSNIIDLLDRDVIMYDQNYALKKESLQEAFNCLDLISQKGIEIKNNSQFIQRAKEAYNGLLCSVTDSKIYQEFYRLAVDISTSGYVVEDIEMFKISCRKELLGKHKVKHEGFKGSPNGALNNGRGIKRPMGGILQNAQSSPTRQQPSRPIQPRPKQPRQNSQIDSDDE